MSFENPTLQDLLKQAIEARVTDIHVSLPGIVTKYDPVTQMAEVQPAIKKKYTNGKVVNLPIITNVPVLFPRGKESWIHIPLEKDDTVLLVFVERSMDNFILQGGIQDPDDFRKHHLSDAVAIPGLFPKGKQMTGTSATGADFVHGKAAMRMTKDGKTRIGLDSSTPAEPVPLGFVLRNYLEDIHEELAKLMDILIAGNHVMVTSPGNPTAPEPTAAANFTAIKSALAALKASPISDSTFISDIFFTEKGE